MVPLIEVTPAVVEVGPISNEKVTAVEVQVHNRGKALLKVNSVKTNCACTQGRMVSTDVRAGETGTLEVFIDPFRIFGFEARKMLTLYTNDPKNGAVELPVHVTIEPEFLLNPRDFEFGSVEKGRPAELTMVLRPLGGRVVTIKRIEALGDALVADVSTFEEEEGGGRVYRIHARLRDDLLPGEHEQAFKVYLECKRMPYILCHARALVNAPYRVNPKRLVIAEGITAGAGSATVKGQEPFRVEDVRTEGNCITVRTEATGASDALQLVTQPARGLGAGKYNDAVLFTVVLGGESYANRLPVGVTVR
ncbi:MAG TPA: DUF1573 domain-containing protein [Candidatus Hydrogenedentes bacterium]|nr:DUF1573 domain-containing protein [Candidatus Hydrogenedentota bacterium]